MEILQKELANTVKELFLLSFIDQDSSRYREQIAIRRHCSDGDCYYGYLWDFLKNKKPKTEKYCFQFLSSKQKLYLFWDSHSKDRIYITDYWKYPKESVIELSGIEFVQYSNTFPEDIYLFDDSFFWSIAFTHEYSDKGRRMCFLTRVANVSTGTVRDDNYC